MVIYENSDTCTFTNLFWQSERQEWFCRWHYPMKCLTSSFRKLTGEAFGWILWRNPTFLFSVHFSLNEQQISIRKKFYQWTHHFFILAHNSFLKISSISFASSSASSASSSRNWSSLTRGNFCVWSCSWLEKYLINIPNTTNTSLNLLSHLCHWFCYDIISYCPR